MLWPKWISDEFPVSQKKLIFMWWLSLYSCRWVCDISSSSRRWPNSLLPNLPRHLCESILTFVCGLRLLLHLGPVSSMAMKLWGPLKLIWTPYSENWNWISCGHGPLSAKIYVTGFTWPSYACGPSYTICNNNSRVVKFEVPRSLGFVVNPCLWGGLDAKSSRPWNMRMSCHGMLDCM